MKINPNMSKYDYMLESSKNYMDYIALTFNDRKITYEEMFESIEKYVKLLRKKGVNKGDVIGVCTLNSPESVYLLYALNYLGAIVVGYSPFDNASKIRQDIELERPKMIITTDFSYGNFKNIEKSLNISTLLYSPLDGSNNFKVKLGYTIMQLLSGNVNLDQRKKIKYLLQKEDLSDVCTEKAMYINGELSDILFTGGSTGIHKGVDLNDVGLNSEIEGMKLLYDENFFEGKTYLGQIPFGHMAFGRSLLHAALTNGMTYALSLKALPQDFYDELVRTGANGASGGPPHWTSLIELKNGIYVPRSDLKPGSLKKLQVTFSGGEALKKSMLPAINEALAYCGCDKGLGDGLGATETWASNILNTGNYFREGKLGVALPNLDVKLLDPDTGLEVEKGQKGILFISGPSLMIGYHNNETETNKVISYDSDGKKWLNLGDYLIEDEDGFYRYVGREKRNFVCGCENIYPEQIEDLLNKLPEVREAVVVPIEDDLLQFVPYYFISLYDDQIDYSSFEKKLYDIISTCVSVDALPKKISYINEPLVRMSNSKIDVEYYRKSYGEKGKIKSLNK